MSRFMAFREDTSMRICHKWRMTNKVHPGNRWCGACRREKPEIEFSKTASRCRYCCALAYFQARTASDEEAITNALFTAQRSVARALGLPTYTRPDVAAASKIRRRERERSPESKAIKRAYRKTPERRKSRATYTGAYQKRPEVAPIIKVRKRLARMRERGGRMYVGQNTAEWAVVESWLCREFNGRCCYCGASERPLTIDHVDPVSKGGGNRVRNLALACAPCNSTKSNRTLESLVGVSLAALLRGRLENMERDLISHMERVLKV